MARAKIDKGGVIRIAASKSNVLKRNPRSDAGFLEGVLGVIMVSTNGIRMIEDRLDEEIND